MNEIVTTEHTEKVLQVIAFAAPAVGLIVGTIVGKMKKRLVPGIVAGVLAGLIGTAVFGLWRLYHVFCKHGTCNLKVLAVQIVIFAAVGVVAGTVIQRRIDLSSMHERVNDSLNTNQEEKLNA